MSITKSGTRWRLLLIAFGVVLLSPFFVIMGWLKWNESELVFMTVLSKVHSTNSEKPRPIAKDANVRLLNGQVLPAYSLAPAPERERGFWILHLHGNADTAFSEGQYEHALYLRQQGFHVLSFDYRGFGNSPGEASEKNVYEDAEAALQFLLSQEVPPDRIILWGHSLGSGPAVELATRHAVAAVVLFGAFTSVPDRAAELYPWLPVRAIAGIKFNNLSRISSIKSPVLIAHAKTDLTIPAGHSERLFAAAREPKRLLMLQALSHDGFGGHYEAAYEQLDSVVPLLMEMIGE